MIKFFSENSERLLSVNYFYKITPWQMFDRVLNAPIDEVRALPSDNIITKAILKNVSKVSTLLYSNNFIERKLQDRCFSVKFSCKGCKGCKGAAVHRCFSK